MMRSGFMLFSLNIEREDGRATKKICDRYCCIREMECSRDGPDAVITMGNPVFIFGSSMGELRNKKFLKVFRISLLPVATVVFRLPEYSFIKSRIVLSISSTLSLKILLAGGQTMVLIYGISNSAMVCFR